MADTIKLKRGHSDAWKRKNIVLAPGEVGVELDTHQMKVGDGETPWNELPYVGGASAVNMQELSKNGATVDGVPYQTLEDAIANAPAGSIIRLNKNFNGSVSFDKNMNINLNGNNMINNEATPIEVQKNATIIIKGSGTVECNKHSQPALLNNGDLNIQGGTYQRSVDVSGNGYYTFVNHGISSIEDAVFMSGGTFSSMIENGYWDYNSGSPETGYVDGVNYSMPKLTIHSGTFAGGLYAIKNDDYGEIVIEDGTFYNTILAQGHSLTISGGYFENSKEADGEYNIFIRKLSDEMNCQDTIITGGTFITAQPTNFKVEGEPNIQISGGRFNRQLDPSYLASGYIQVLEDDFYVVKKEATING